MVSQWGMLLMVAGLGCILKGVDSKARVKVVEMIFDNIQRLTHGDLNDGDVCKEDSNNYLQERIIFNWSGKNTTEIVDMLNMKHEDGKVDDVVSNFLTSTTETDKDYPITERCNPSKGLLCVKNVCKACDKLTGEEKDKRRELICYKVSVIVDPKNKNFDLEVKLEKQSNTKKSDKSASGRVVIAGSVVAVLTFALIALPLTDVLRV